MRKRSWTAILATLLIVAGAGLVGTASATPSPATQAPGDLPGVETARSCTIGDTDTVCIQEGRGGTTEPGCPGEEPGTYWGYDLVTVNLPTGEEDRVRVWGYWVCIGGYGSFHAYGFGTDAAVAGNSLGLSYEEWERGSGSHQETRCSTVVSYETEGAGSGSEDLGCPAGPLPRLVPWGSLLP